MLGLVLFDVELWCTDYGGSGESGELRLSESESERDDRMDTAALSCASPHKIEVNRL